MTYMWNGIEIGLQVIWKNGLEWLKIVGAENLEVGLNLNLVI